MAKIDLKELYDKFFGYQSDFPTFRKELAEAPGIKDLIKKYQGFIEKYGEGTDKATYQEVIQDLQALLGEKK